VARQLRRDRRRIVLLWLRLLQEDVGNLWRFRRFLVRHGAPVAPREEFKVAAAALAAVAFLGLLRALVWVAGPFAVAALASRARTHVERTSWGCADLLGRLPETVWPELERSWMTAPTAAELR
jgi:hypothetical protein